jgi:hypothetical protein
MMVWGLIKYRDNFTSYHHHHDHCFLVGKNLSTDSVSFLSDVT